MTFRTQVHEVASEAAARLVVKYHMDNDLSVDGYVEERMTLKGDQTVWCAVLVIPSSYIGG